ncbi:hypothetical protein MAHJHV64_11380 [Mycobacterium avium subsp. hominissuis]|jgi:hypothetical protein
MMAEIDIMTQTAPYPRELARAGMCCGCGYYFAVHGAHRADCTTEARRERDRSGRARCDCCGDKTPVKSLRWDRYRWQCAACAGGLIGAGNGA